MVANGSQHSAGELYMDADAVLVGMDCCPILARSLDVSSPPKLSSRFSTISSFQCRTSLDQSSCIVRIM